MRYLYEPTALQTAAHRHEPSVLLLQPKTHFPTCSLAPEHEALGRAWSAPSSNRLPSFEVKPLSPEYYPAANTEPRLHSAVLVPIFDRRPDEQGADDKGRQDDDEQTRRRQGAHGRYKRNVKSTSRSLSVPRARELPDSVS